LIYENIQGVPKFECDEYEPRHTKYCILIPIINEGMRIKNQLQKAQLFGVDRICDVIICDGGSTDGCTEKELLKSLGVNSLLTKQDIGKQGAQIRMGLWWALERGYEGFITIDGNDKDSIEDIQKFTKKLDEGYDFVQGSRFIKGGKAINTPLMRWIAVRLIHAPIISLTARQWFTDTTNAYRAHSRRYITHCGVQPFREIFQTYELLAYLSVRASQLGLKACEVPVTREYPKHEKIPTKIKGFSGNYQLMKILFENLIGKFGV
jgi:dolichol-phosphate mannosyltransferase